MPTSCCAEAPSSRPRIRLRILQLDVLSASRTFPVLKLGSSGNAVYQDLGDYFRVADNLSRRFGKLLRGLPAMQFDFHESGKVKTHVFSDFLVRSVCHIGEYQICAL